MRTVDVGAWGCRACGRDGAEAAAQRKESQEARLDRIHAADRRSGCFSVAGQLPPGQMHGATYRPRFRQPDVPIFASISGNRKINK